MASRLQDVILRGLAADKPVATDVAPGTLYYSSDSQVTERSDGTTWESYSDSGSGSVGLHAATHGPIGTDPVTLTQSQITNLTTDLAGKASTTHASAHGSAGADPVTVTALAGYPGGTINFLRSDGTFAAPPASPVRIGSVGLIIDGGASVITTGLKGFLEIPFACTIQAVTLLADVSGSIVIDVWKAAYSAYPPTVANTITASAKPTITTAVKSQDLTLTGWTTAVAAGDVLGFNVDSVATIKRVTLSLKVQAV